MSTKFCRDCGLVLPEDGSPCPNCKALAAEMKRKRQSAKAPPGAAATPSAQTKAKQRSAAAAKAIAVLAGVGNGLKALPSATATKLKALPSGTVKAAKALPSGTVKAAKALPGGTVKVAKAIPAGTVKAAKATSSGAVKAAKAIPAGAVKAAKTAPKLMSGVVGGFKKTPSLFARMGGKIKAAFVAMGSAIKTTTLKVLKAPAIWWGKLSKRWRLGLMIGVPTAVVLVAVAVFIYFFLRPVFVVNFDTEDAVVSGDDVVLVVDVANDGRTTGDYEIKVLVDGEPAQTESVTVDAGEQQQVEVAVAGLEAAHYDIALADQPELVTNVWVMTPPEFELGRVRVAPDKVDITTSDQTEVSVEVANVGEATGSYELELCLDGEVVETREIELAGGDYSNESFAMTVPEAGTFEVSVNDECTDLDVYQLWRHKNGKILVKNGKSGRGQMKIKNISDQDCIVVLTKPGEDKPAVLAVYVRAESTYKVRGIGIGTYECYYMFGEEWCAYRDQFTEEEWAGKFDETMKYKSSSTFYYYTYTIYTLEIGRITALSPYTSSVDVEDFPEL